MISDYKQEVLQIIESQEFYNEIKKYIDTETFDDIIDFLKIYNIDWYKELGYWSSEFLLQHLSLYEELYKFEKSKTVVLNSLYWDLDKNYKEFLMNYSHNQKMQNALHLDNEFI